MENSYLLDLLFNQIKIDQNTEKQKIKQQQKNLLTLLKRKCILKVNSKTEQANNIDISCENIQIEVKDYEKIGVKGCQILRKCLNILIRLRQLNLNIMNNNFITYEGCFELSQGIFCLKKLEKLQIFISSYNNVWYEGFQILSQTISKLQLLSTLDIQFGKYNNIGVSGFDEQQDFVEYPLNLQYLNIKIDDNNFIEQQIIDRLFQRIIHLNNLISFSIIIGENNLNSDGCLSLFKIIQNMKNINHLCIFLFDNHIEFDQLYKINQSLQYINSLSSLKLLFQCPFDSQSIQQLSSSIQKLQKLEQLELKLHIRFDVNRNEFAILGKQIYSLINLKYLKLQFSKSKQIVYVKNNSANHLYVQDPQQNNDHLITIKTDLKYQQINEQIQQDMNQSLSGTQQNTIQDKQSQLIQQSLQINTMQGFFQGLDILVNINQLILQLDGDLFEENELNYLAESVKNMNNLNEFTLIIGKEINFNLEGYKKLFEEIKEMKELKNLQLQIQQELTYDHSFQLNEGLKKLVQLQYCKINISKSYDLLHLDLLNYLVEIDSKNIKLQNLFEIQIKRNQFKQVCQVKLNVYVERGDIFGNALLQMQYLQKLQLQIFVKRNTDLYELTKCISNLQNLNNLQLKINGENISFDVVIILFKIFNQMGKLIQIFLNINEVNPEIMNAHYQENIQYSIDNQNIDSSQESYERYQQECIKSTDNQFIFFLKQYKLFIKSLKSIRVFGFTLKFKNEVLNNPIFKEDIYAKKYLIRLVDYSYKQN